MGGLSLSEGLTLILVVILGLLIVNAISRVVRIWKINKRTEDIVNTMCSADYVAELK